MWGPNGDLSPVSYEQTAQMLRAVGYLKDPVPYEQFFDRQFVERALQDLGRK